MGHYNIHFSPTGGTKKVADIICGSGKMHQLHEMHQHLP